MQITFIRKPELLKQLSFSHSRLYSNIRDGLFTKPVKILKTSVWPQHEINEIARAILAGYSEGQLRELVERLEANRKIDVQ